MNMAASMMKEKLSDIFAESTRDDKSDFDEIDTLITRIIRLRRKIWNKKYLSKNKKQLR